MRNPVRASIPPDRQVLGPSNVESRFEAQHQAGTSPLLGREEELELLLRRWGQAKRGEGRVVLITGEPGIGKSRIVRALRDQLTSDPHTSHSYVCSPHHQSSALYPHAMQLTRAAGIERDDSAGVRLDKIKTLLAQSSGDLDQDIPFIAALLSIPGGDRYPLPQMTPQHRKERTLSALSAALAQLAAAELIFQRGVPPDATYQFKHALVQDAAYTSLVRSRRQQLHGQIAKALEQQFPEVVASEPEVLAHHFTQGDLPELASLHWLAAGRASLSKFALSEVVHQLRLGLGQIELLAHGATRDRKELDTQLCLGNAIVQSKGVAAPEADLAFNRAYALRTMLSRSTELIPVLFGILINSLIGGQPRRALEIAQEMVSSTQGDRQAELVANTMLMDVHFWLGNFERADHYLSRAMPLYNDESDIHLIKSYPFDMKMVNLIYVSHFQWMMGYPERALRTKADADAWAKRLNNPFMFAFADIWGSGVFHYAGRLDEHRQQLQDGIEISKRIGMPFWVAQAEMWSAWNQASAGDRSIEPIALFKGALTQYAGTGSGAIVPYFRALHADALSKRGDTSSALELLQTALDGIEAHGEAVHAAEIHRIRAVVLARDGVERYDEAEPDFIKALAVARSQRAKAWELRSATGYGQLLKELGRASEARDLLKPVYDWFTEGFDTKDLKEARTLLAVLSAANA